MTWGHLMSLFFAGAFLTNALPHLVSGVMGRPFQSPFAKPPGQGLSSATINVLWGFFNLAIGYMLACRTTTFDIVGTADVIAFGFGAVLVALLCARLFGRFNGGNAPTAL